MLGSEPALDRRRCRGRRSAGRRPGRRRARARTRPARWAAATSRAGRRSPEAPEVSSPTIRLIQPRARTSRGRRPPPPPSRRSGCGWASAGRSRGRRRRFRPATSEAAARTPGAGRSGCRRRSARPRARRCRAGTPASRSWSGPRGTTIESPSAPPRRLSTTRTLPPRTAPYATWRNASPKMLAATPPAAPAAAAARKRRRLTVKSGHPQSRCRSSVRSSCRAPHRCR